MKRFALVALAALALAGCSATPPPVSPQVQKYYDEHVAGQPASPSQKAAAPVVAFLGDSYTAGAGAPEGGSWTTLLSKNAGWAERGFGFGGTNYGTAGTLPGGTSYVDRVSKVIAANPSKVIVSGGQNNLGFDQQPGIQATFTGLRAGLPKADIIALSPFWKAEPIPPALQTVSDEVKAAVESVGGKFVDIKNPLQGHPELLDADGVHPNAEGHKLIAEKVRAALG